MDIIRISLVQYAIHWRDKEANFKTVEQMVEGLETDVIVLPEMFNTAFAVRNPEDAEALDGSSVGFMKALARAHGCLVLGSVMLEEEGRRTNSMLAVDPEGSILARYDKQHLFGLSHEHLHFKAGSKTVDLVWRGWKMRMIVCYDLRFPYASYNHSDYDALMVAANWPSMRIGHWDALLQARAIENQAYVVAVNRVGMDPFGVSYPGHSSVYGPAGDLELRFIGEQVRTVVLERSVLNKLRSELPFLTDQIR